MCVPRIFRCFFLFFAACASFFCMFLLLLIVCADSNLHVSRFAKFIDRSAWAAQRQRRGRRQQRRWQHAQLFIDKKMWQTEAKTTENTQK